MPGGTFCWFEYIHVLENLKVSQIYVEYQKMGLPVPMWESSFIFLIDKIKLSNFLFFLHPYQPHSFRPLFSCVSFPAAQFPSLLIMQDGYLLRHWAFPSLWEEVHGSQAVMAPPCSSPALLASPYVLLLKPRSGSLHLSPDSLCGVNGYILPCAISLPLIHSPQLTCNQNSLGPVLKIHYNPSTQIRALLPVSHHSS